MALKKATIATPAKEETLTEQGVEAIVEQEAEAKAPVEEKVTSAETEAEAEVEASAEPEADPSTAVSTTSNSQMTAVQAQANGMARFTQEQAEAGYEGLELTGMSFDRIKLHEGQFKLGTDEAELGTQFDCVVYGTRELFVVRQSSDSDAESFFSYDPKGQTFTDGTSAQEKLAEWLDDGYGDEDSPLDIRPYIEATAVLVGRDDEYEGMMVMLSIPPASKARLSGIAAQAAMRMKANLGEVVVRAQVGNKVGDGQKAFRPWTFKLVGRYEG